jgi:hypothetical protein
MPGKDVADNELGLASRVLTAGVQEQLVTVMGHHDAISKPAPRLLRHLVLVQQLCGPPHMRLILKGDLHPPVICHAAESMPGQPAPLSSPATALPSVSRGAERARTKRRIFCVACRVGSLRIEGAYHPVLHSVGYAAR